MTMSQNQAILEYLKTHEWIDWEVARLEPSIRSNNLTGRIDNLEKKGHRFEKQWITLESGKECKRYRLINDPELAVNPPGCGDAWEPPYSGKITWYECKNGHKLKFYGIGRELERCMVCFEDSKVVA